MLVPCCGQSFCHGCIASWLKKNFKCPLCGAQLKETQLVKNRTLQDVLSGIQAQSHLAKFNGLKEFDIALEASVNNRNNKIGSEVPLLIKIEKKINVSLDTTFLSIVDNDYFQTFSYWVNDSSNINNKLVLEVMLYPKLGANVFNLPELLLLELRTDEKVLASTKIHFPMDTFTDDFYPNDNSQILNILLFGVAGSTKSSFVNSCYSLLSKTVNPEIAVTGGSSPQITTDIKSFRLGCLDSQKQSMFRLWDVWGNNDEALFEDLLVGKFPSGTSLKAIQNLRDPSQLRNSQPQPGCSQHTVIFFVPVSEIADSQSKIVQTTLKFVKRLRKWRMQFIVVLSKIDSICPDYSPTKPSDTIQQKVAQAAQLFGVRKDSVFPLINYAIHNSFSKSRKIDCCVYQILYAAASCAKWNAANVE